MAFSPRPTDDYRVNKQIRIPEVRVIGADGAQLGILRTDEARRQADELGLDLVEVSPKAMPPVCKIMDYGKFKYEEARKKKDAKKNQTVQELKEIKFRPKTDDHDFDFKVKHIRRFIEEGNKVKLGVVFRGREIVHPETGHDVLKRVVEVCGDIAMVEHAPMMEGKRMLMIIAPRPVRGALPVAGAPGLLRPQSAPVPMAAQNGGASSAPRPTTAPAQSAAAAAPRPTTPTSPAARPAPRGPIVETKVQTPGTAKAPPKA